MHLRDSGKLGFGRHPLGGGSKLGRSSQNHATLFGHAPPLIAASVPQVIGGSPRASGVPDRAGPLILPLVSAENCRWQKDLRFPHRCQKGNAQSHARGGMTRDFGRSGPQNRPKSLSPGGPAGSPPDEPGTGR